jgi:tetratricopeptide (TPR) repeat protein
MAASNWSLALDSFRQSLGFREACLKQSNTDQMTEYGIAVTVNNIGLALCEQRNYAEGLPMLDQAVRRQEALADRDKANWIFQDLLTGLRLEDAQGRVAAAKAGVFSDAECLRLLEQARTSYQRCLEKLTASEANPSRMKSWVTSRADEVKRSLKEVEAAVAALKNKE